MKTPTTKQPTSRKLPITPIVCPVMLILLGVLIMGPADAANAAGFSQGKTATANDPFAKIRKAVLNYFSKTPQYQPGDLIVRQEAQKVFALLQKGGVTVRDQQAILAKMLPEGDFLAKTLRGSNQGRKFMHQIASYPLAYDQLDRLREQPVGRRTVASLVRGPDGYKMLQYMTTPNGKNLGRMLTKDKKEGNYNRPTGRIYTADQLIEAIKEQLTL